MERLELKGLAGSRFLGKPEKMAPMGSQVFVDALERLVHKGLVATLASAFLAKTARMGCLDDGAR